MELGHYRLTVGFMAIVLLGNALAWKLYESHTDRVFAMNHAVPGDWAQLGRYVQANKKVPPGLTVFFGDSITEWWDLSSNSSYVNRGIGGQITPQMVARFSQDVLGLHPKTVVILAGTNDTRGIADSLPIETTQENIRTMVELSRLRGIRPILCSLPPLGHHPIESLKDPVAELASLNTWLRSYAHQEKITLVDYFDPLLGADDAMKPALTVDGIHPNRAGYAVMRPLVDAAIKD